MTSEVPDAHDLRNVIDAVLDPLAALPDGAWDLPAYRLDWTCRETAAHLVDDLVLYAMNLAGTNPPQHAYIDLVDRPAAREGAPAVAVWPDPAGGTQALVRCLDAAGGLLAAVTATAPPGRIGYHPRGLADASGFAAMGIVETAVHAWDILTAHDIDLRVDPEISGRTLNRLFPGAVRTADAWLDLRAATGRTSETAGKKWTWDSSVRTSYET